MSRVRITSSASIEETAIQILVMLRENLSGSRQPRYTPNSLKAILEFEMALPLSYPEERDGIVTVGNAIVTAGHVTVPEWLSEKFWRAVGFLKQHDLIARDPKQRDEEFVTLTEKGRQIEIDRERNRLLLPRPWDAWYTEYGQHVCMVEIREGGSSICGSAFFVGPDRLGTCAHLLFKYENNPIEGTVRVPYRDVVVHVGDATLHATEAEPHQSADVASFSLQGGQSFPELVLPICDELPTPGSNVAALGFPRQSQRESTLTISPGPVESHPESFDGGLSFLHLGFEISGGQSGGPVIDEYGRVIAITTERTFEDVNDERTPAKPFSYATPMRYLMETLPNS